MNKNEFKVMFGPVMVQLPARFYNQIALLYLILPVHKNTSRKKRTNPLVFKEIHPLYL